MLFRPSPKVAAAKAGGAATPAEIQEVMQKLEHDDTELTKLLNSFGEDWAATGADQSPNSAVAEKLRKAHHATLQAKVRERQAAAQRAEIVAEQVEKLKGAPSLKALKKAAE